MYQRTTERPVAAPINQRIAELLEAASSMEVAPETIARAKLARKQFQGLPAGLQVKLVTVAARHNIVFRTLAMGEWDSVTRALYGLNLTYPDRGYMTIATEFDHQIVNVLAQ